MNILKDIVGGILSPVKDVVVSAIEKKERIADIENAFEIAKKDLEFKFEAELTKRHNSDMASDSWLSKNVRPASLVFLLGLTLMLSVTDGNLGDFNVKESYINMIESMAFLTFSFYFGSRGLEKVAKIKK